MSYSIYDLNTRISNLQSTVGTISSKTASLQIPVSPSTLDVINQVFVHDSIQPETVTVNYNNIQISDAGSKLTTITSGQILLDDTIQTTTITPNLITLELVGDTHQTHVDNTQVHILDTSTGDEMFIDHNSLILVQPTTTHQTELLGNMLDFQTPENIISCGHTTYQDGHPGFESYDLLTGDNSLLGITSLRITSSVGTQSVLDSDTLTITDPTHTSTLSPVSLTFVNGVATSTLDASNWSGNIQTVNTVANITHYLNFSDSSGTGYGKPQKTVGLSCNPSTNTITATIFSGSLTGNSSSSSSVALTSDNTAGTYFLPFSKTIASNSTLYVDNTTTPLTYNPSTSTLTCSIVNAIVSTATTSNNILTTSDNTATTCYIPFIKTTASASSAIYVDDITGPLTYVPSTGTCSALIFSGDCVRPVTMNTATFSAGALTISGSSLSCKNSNIIFTGNSNTVSSLSISGTIVNGVYYIGIYNNGSGNLTFNTGLGTNIKTVHSSGVSISSGNYGLLKLNVLTINALTITIVTVNSLTN